MSLEIDLQFLLAAMIGSVIPTLLWVRSERKLRRQESRTLFEAITRPGPTARGATFAEAHLSEAQRFELLENDVEALEERMDRLGESHDFLSRLLAERIDHMVDPRLRTPH